VDIGRPHAVAFRRSTGGVFLNPADVHAAPELVVPLRAGPLRLVFDRGELRWIRLGEREVLRGIYVAVREPGWATVPGTMEDLVIEAEPDSFRVRFVSRHRRGDVHFDWEGRIDGFADGRIVYSLDGRAGRTFLRNRIGFCVLHPLACAGRECLLETVDGDRRATVFPALVSPHQPFFQVRAILHEVTAGVEAEVRLEGETFETEDQRNWGDASFKTYGTPLALPYPAEVSEGAEIRQAVTVRLFGVRAEPVREAVATVPGAMPKPRNSAEPVIVLAGAAASMVRPALGLGGAGLVELDEAAAQRLRPLRLDHLRADLRLAEEGWEVALERAAANARLVGAPLELALFVPEPAGPALAALAARVAALGAPVASWLLWQADGLHTPGGLAAAARALLSGVAPGALFGGGTNRYFAELNRQRPSPAGLDRVAFSLNPQVHAFDDATIVECLGSLPSLADTVRSFAPGAGIAISPVTLRPREDPRPASSRGPGEPPFTDDPRQPTPFAAAWTLGLLAAAARARLASLTLFELLGPRGVLDANAGTPFPVALALADVAAVQGAAVLDVRSRRPERVQVLALHAGSRTRLFLANVTGATHPVRIEGLAGAARLAALGDPGRGEESGAEVELAPHAIVRLDVGEAELPG
jgi:hypothetical protein